MRSAKLTLLFGLIVLIAAGLTGCLGEKSGVPQALFIGSPVEHVIPFTANFDGTLSYDPNGEIVSYLWNFGDGGAGNGPQVSHIYRENGEYVVELTVVDNKGIANSSSLTVQALNPPPTASFTFSPKSWYEDRYIVGASEWITFDASASTDDGSVVAYDWDFDDGETADGPVVKHRYLWPGDYNVVLTVTDDDGGQTSTVEAVHILGGPPCNGDICNGGTCGG
jgi:PKD repeat protein